MNHIMQKNIFNRILYFTVLLCVVASCNTRTEYWNTLSQVESFIEERPDSALFILEQTESRPSTKEEKAKYALLLSMALDKNLIDKTDFEVLQPAIEFYKDKGSATDKLRTLYYQGRIHQNKGENALAIECFLNAINKGVKSDDILTKARAYFAQGKIYYALYDWDSFIENNQKAAHFFKEAGKYNSYAHSLIGIVNGYTLKEDAENALLYIEECRRMLNSINSNMASYFYACYLSYLTDFGLEQDIIGVISEYLKNTPHSKLDWLTISNAYVKLKMYDEALQAISEYDNSFSDITKRRKYLAIISEIYKYLGRYKESLESYESYMALSGNEDYAVIQQDTKFVKERYQLELKALKERVSKKRIFTLATVIIILLLAIIVYIRIRLKVNRMEKIIAEQNAEKYRLLCLHMEEERDNLTELLSKNDELEPDIKTAVAKRLELLNKFFTAYITNNSDIDRKANKEMDELLANKDTFMKSTKFAFAGSHPKFIKYLKERGLTDWEINYCCLYALGLKGKEVGTYIKMRSHYNNSSDIREKLGINEHDTNLGIYIRKLLRESE